MQISFDREAKGNSEMAYYILRQIYYILRYFSLLHFASKVITFWVTEFITFCVKSYYNTFRMLLPASSHFQENMNILHLFFSIFTGFL